MHKELFDDIFERQIHLCEEKLLAKREEYAPDHDVLHNFKVAAELQKETPRQALAGMMAKHTVSIFDMACSNEHFTLDQWDEKLTDHINYLIILSAIIQEEDELRLIGATPDPFLMNTHTLSAANPKYTERV